MANATTETPDFVEHLDQVRFEFNGGQPQERRRLAKTLPELQASRRRSHRGGDFIVKRNAERYLNCPIKSERRFQIRKIVDEAGQDIFGGPMPNHEELARWESEELGVTREEMEQLRYEDPTPESLIFSGWWLNCHREGHWAVAMGTAYAGEGLKIIEDERARLLQAIEEKRELYQELGVRDVERALVRDVEHSGVDIDHAEFDAHIIRTYVTDPEVKEEMKQAFILRLSQGRF